jgi:S-DNA-T family DNA segregation ATPase FtsK/SpoIIIE
MSDRDVEQQFDTSFDLPLDEEPPRTAKPVYVDVVSRTHEVVPIVPANLRSWEGIKKTAARNARLAGRRTAVHAVRLPFVYTPQALFWAVPGLFKVLGKQIAWWWLWESTSARQDAATKNDWFTYEKALKTARNVRLFRGLVLLPELLFLLILVLVLWKQPAFVPMWIPLLVVAAAVPFLAHVGRPADRPIVSAAVVTPRFRRLNPDVVLRAYYAAGLGHPDKPDKQIMFGGRLTRDAKDTGSMVPVDLPYGTTYADAVGAKEKLASGLDVTAQQVFLTKDRKSERRHELFVADTDPLAIPVGRTDMLDCKPRNIWRPMRIGKDERDRLVSLYLLWNSVLVGAQPRKGKTFFVRLLLLYAALDPWVKILFADGKKSSDYDKVRLVAHRMVIGDAPNPRDDDPITHFLEMLDEVLAHIAKVNDILSELPVEMCPKGTLTEDLARDPRFPDLRVWIVAIEEFQVYFETEDQDVNKLVAHKLQRIMAQGPSAGVILLSSSQKPSGVGAGDVGRLFNRFRDNHQVRFALRCGNRVVSEAVLGGDAYSEGYDASALPIGDGENGTNDYRGIGILYGASDNTPTVRTFLAEHTDAEKILIAARHMRERFGTLSGLAAGEDLVREYRDVMGDARSVFYAGEARISWPELAERMRTAMPEHYADLKPAAISAQLRALGVPGKSVHDPKHFEKGKGQGFDLAELDAVIERRAVTSE